MANRYGNLAFKIVEDENFKPIAPRPRLAVAGGFDGQQPPSEGTLATFGYFLQRRFLDSNGRKLASIIDLGIPEYRLKRILKSDAPVITADEATILSAALDMSAMFFINLSTRCREKPVRFPAPEMIF